MTQIEWKEEYSVGNASVDQEHKLLITQVNKLYEQLKLPLDTGTIESMLTDIQVDISTHFALEELLMQEAGFVEFEDHKKDHDSLLDQIDDMIFHLAEDPEIGRELLINSLSDWFINHLKSFDDRLHNQLS